MAIWVQFTGYKQGWPVRATLPKVSTRGCTLEILAAENWRRFGGFEDGVTKCTKRGANGEECTLPRNHAGTLHVCAADGRLFSRWVEV